ncbi:MAG TPA: hypothetical protein VFV86_10670 [Nitrososphaeraceae archaeon]|nr:hypothetical protein [Nitrososphaeraceae archaeon]
MNNVLNNQQVEELFNTLNVLNSPPKSPQENAVAKTLRNIKRDWLGKHIEKLQDIDDEHCAVKTEADGTKVFVKQTLKKSTIGKNGETITTEFQVNCYGPNDEKKRKAQRNTYMLEKANQFEIITTDDDTGLSAYQKEVLFELGFLKKKPKKEEQTETQQ